MEKDCGELGVLFQETISDIKGSFSIWEEFNSKATKLNSAIKVTIAASISFHEAFAKLAEMANGTRGACKDIGHVLLNLCARHQAMEIKLKAYTMSLIDLLVTPIQKMLDDWQKTVVQLDKDHSRDYKKACSELKRASGETARLQKKFNKGRTELRTQLDEASRDANTKYVLLEDVEKRSVRSALLEERSHLCFLASCLKPVLDNEISMFTEVHHLQGIADNLSVLSSGCNSGIPATVEQVICDASKRKASKEDPYIEVVLGSLTSSGDLVHTPMVDLTTPDTADSLQAKLGSSEGTMYQGHYQSLGLMQQRMTIQRSDAVVCAVDQRMTPYESCQSLQCSSGYGTMTNISIGSNETGGAFEEPFHQSYDLTQGEKFCTLPNRRPFSARHADPCRPTYAAIQDMFVKHDQDALRTANTGHDPCRLAHLAGNRPVHGAAQIYSQPAQHHQGPFHRQASYSLSDDDEDDDLPLPPPPEELISSPSEHRLGAPNYAGNVHRKLSCTLPRNAPAVQNLPGVLALRSSARRESECSRISNWSDKSSGLSSSLEVEENAEHSLSRQLKSVKLKRAESYDRSSPRILKQ